MKFGGSRKFRRQAAVSLIEVLAAAVIIFIVLAAAIGAYFVSVFQSAREIVDTETKALSRSVEDAIRSGSRVNMSLDRKSFFADIEGVRVFIPLPQPGQPYVDLPDYNEDINGNGSAQFGPAGPDIDWDMDGILDAPAYAKPETIHDDLDHDGDGLSWEDGDRAGSPKGSPEPFYPSVGNRSPAYDDADNDGDGIVNDLARYMYPMGLLSFVQDGVFREQSTTPRSWMFHSGLSVTPVVFAPMDEDANRDGTIATVGAGAEAALNLNLIVDLGPGVYFPDTYEDLDRDGRITRSSGPVIRDVNGAGDDFFEFSEDFNLNGFLDVPSPTTTPGRIFYRSRYAGLPADPLSEGLLQLPIATPSIQPVWGANFAYSAQIQHSRSFGYTLRVQRVEGAAGASQGYGTINKAVYRFTLSLYFNYVQTLRDFQSGLLPEPIRVQVFEVTIE